MCVVCYKTCFQLQVSCMCLQVVAHAMLGSRVTERELGLQQQVADLSQQVLLKKEQLSAMRAQVRHMYG